MRQECKCKSRLIIVSMSHEVKQSTETIQAEKSFRPRTIHHPSVFAKPIPSQSREAGGVSSCGAIRRSVEPRKRKKNSPPPLVARLLLRNLRRLRLLLAQEAEEEVVRVPADNQARRNGRLAIGDQSLATNLLHLPLVGAEHVLLRLGPLLQREEDNALSVAVDLICGLLDVGELGVEGRERGVAERIRLRDVGRDVLVGFGEVGREGRGELGVG